MTQSSTIDPAVEIEISKQHYARATVAYLTRLREIVGSLDTLTEGGHGHDYAVTVRASEKPRIWGLLADLRFEIDEEFGVTITTLAVSGEDQSQ
jgi:hypothetical protein